METRFTLRSKRDALSSFAIRADDIIDLHEPYIRVEGDAVVLSPLCDVAVLSADLSAALARQAGVEPAAVAVYAGQCVGLVGIWRARAWYHLYFTVSVPFVTQAQRVKELLCDADGIAKNTTQEVVVTSVRCSTVISDDGQPLPPLQVPLQPLHLFRPLVHHLFLLAGLAGLLVALMAGWRDYATDRACPLTRLLNACLPTSLESDPTQGLCGPEDTLYRYHFDIWARSIVTDSDSFALLIGSIPAAVIAAVAVAAVVGPFGAFLYAGGMALAHGLEMCCPRSPTFLWLERQCLKADRWASLPEDGLVWTGLSLARVLAPAFSILALAAKNPPLVAPRVTGSRTFRFRWTHWYAWSQTCLLQGSLGAVVWTFLLRYLCLWTGLGQVIHWALELASRGVGGTSLLTAQERWLRPLVTTRPPGHPDPALLPIWHVLSIVGFLAVVALLLYHAMRDHRRTPAENDAPDLGRTSSLYGTFPTG